MGEGHPVSHFLFHPIPSPPQMPGTTATLGSIKWAPHGPFLPPPLPCLLLPPQFHPEQASFPIFPQRPHPPALSCRAHSPALVTPPPPLRWGREAAGGGWAPLPAAPSGSPGRAGKWLLVPFLPRLQGPGPAETPGLKETDFH
uniref:Formin-like protein 18 isoform X1 n=1 Tax=Phascolarctos cinereus TaxID=38626 RepID=A0A6P5LXR0_PHACI|nr:formin-like protein 18 isoform X1 [Phascolarctos cinereus]